MKTYGKVCEDCGGDGCSGYAPEPRCCHCDGTGTYPAGSELPPGYEGEDKDD